MPVRLKDIAKDLGVSVITVSKALRNHSDISHETRTRVLKRVKELNYRPNLAAQSLVTGRTYMMGLVVPSLVHPFFANVAKGISAVLRQRGFNLVVAVAEDNVENELHAIESLIARQVDALMIASSQSGTGTFHKLHEQNIPYVLIDRRFDGLEANYVGMDDVAVGIAATKHLIDIGCKRIAHIAGSTISPALGRAEGYKRALVNNNISFRPEYFVTTPHTDEFAMEGGYEQARALMQLPLRPDGIFCFNDPVAAGAMRGILESGLRIPDDVALIGCGELPYDELLRVPLSSVDQQSLAMGQRAARMALATVEAKTTVTPREVLLEPRVVVRDSTRRKSMTATP
jgi:LacI family transcriptional regulator